MKNKKEKPILLGHGDCIAYDVLDKTPGGGNLGRAEFVFCPILNGKRIERVEIYRKQQRRDDRWFRVKIYGDYATGLAFKEAHCRPGHQYIAAWNYHRCAEHKGISMSVYVPDGTCRMRVELSGIQTCFIFE